MHDILYMYKFLRDVIFANFANPWRFVKILTISQVNMYVEGGA